jgi:hypothetical protein
MMNVHPETYVKHVKNNLGNNGTEDTACTFCDRKDHGNIPYNQIEGCAGLGYSIGIDKLRHCERANQKTSTSTFTFSKVDFQHTFESDSSSSPSFLGMIMCSLVMFVSTIFFEFANACVPLK